MPTRASPPIHAATPSPPTARPAHPQPLDSHKLFGGTQEVLIRHGNEMYRLRQTRAGKLILTK